MYITSQMARFPLDSVGWPPDFTASLPLRCGACLWSHLLTYLVSVLHSSEGQGGEGTSCTCCQSRPDKRPDHSSYVRVAVQVILRRSDMMMNQAHLPAHFLSTSSSSFIHPPLLPSVCQKWNSPSNETRGELHKNLCFYCSHISLHQIVYHQCMSRTSSPSCHPRSKHCKVQIH